MEQKLIPFDLERALAGDPVQTRDGKPFTQIHKFNTTVPYCIAGVLDGFLKLYTRDGKYNPALGDTNSDLFMAPKVREYWVNVYRNTSGTLELGAEFDKEDLAYNEIPKRTKFLMKHIATIKLTEQI